MSSSKAEDHTNLQEGRPVDSGSEIPRQGRSPDFVLRGSALPGFPVVRTHTPAIWPVRRFLCRSAPVHSDCIVPDSHRILYSPPRGGTSAIQFYIFSDIADYSIPRRIVNEESAASLLPFVLMAKTPSISPKACPRYLIPERIPNFQGILFPLPAVLKPSLLIFRRK